jgi:hypothetical protein
MALERRSDCWGGFQLFDVEQTMHNPIDPLCAQCSDRDASLASGGRDAGWPGLLELNSESRERLLIGFVGMARNLGQ